MERKRILLIAGGAIGFGGAAFLGTRLLLRSEVAKSIATNPAYRNISMAGGLTSSLGFNIGLPQPEELAESLVPLFSTISPFEAVEDIKVQGRQSKYWPKARRTSDIPPRLEEFLIAALSSATQEKGRKERRLSA